MNMQLFEIIPNKNVGGIFKNMNCDHPSHALDKLFVSIGLTLTKCQVCSRILLNVDLDQFDIIPKEAK